MSYFKVKTNQIRFRLPWGSAPDHAAGTALPCLLAGFQGPISKGREGRVWEKGKVEGDNSLLYVPNCGERSTPMLVDDIT